MTWSAIYTLLRQNLWIGGAGVSVAVVCLLLGWRRFERLSRSLQIAVWGLAIGLSLMGLLLFTAVILSNLRKPRDWDFLCFRTYGSVMVNGQSPYDQQLLRQSATPYHPSEQFQALNYCLYPPPSTVLFYPLGFGSIRGAMAAWYGLLLTAFVLAIGYFWLTIDPDRSRLGLAVAIATTTTFFGSVYTFYFAQTTPLILLALFAAIRAPSRSGWWFGLAVVVKPIAAVFSLGLLLQRKWGKLLEFAAAPILATAVFVVLQGTSGLEKWHNHNPLSEDIHHVYFVEEMNQSLLAVTMRWGEAPPGTNPFAYPPFLLLASLIGSITLGVSLRAVRCQSQGLIEYLLTFALLVYPGTLVHYSILLLIPLALAARNADSLIGGFPGGAILWGAIFSLSWLQATFVANLVMWLYLTVQLGSAALLQAKHSAPVARPPAPQLPG